MRPPEKLKSSLIDLGANIAFFTRLPMPPMPAPVHSFAESLWATPLVGLLIGGAGALVMFAGQLVGLDMAIAAALALAVTVALTGALHEDGLADMADSLGGATPERRLEIMKDSSVGTFGALALLLSILLRWSSLAALGLAAIPVLLACHAGSRALMPAFMHMVKNARHDDLSTRVGRPSRKVAVAALLLGGGSLLAVSPALLILCVPLLAALLWVHCRLARRLYGGQTGDVIGALQQVGEVTILLAAATLF